MSKNLDPLFPISSPQFLYFDPLFFYLSSLWLCVFLSGPVCMRMHRLVSHSPGLHACVCAHTLLCLPPWACVHVHAHTCVSLSGPVCMCVHAHSCFSLPEPVYMCMHTLVSPSLGLCACVCTHTCVSLSGPVCMHARTHTHASPVMSWHRICRVSWQPSGVAGPP